MNVILIIVLILALIICIFVIGIKYNPKFLWSTFDQRYCIFYEKTVFYEGLTDKDGDYRFELRRILLPRWLNIFKND